MNLKRFGEYAKVGKKMNELQSNPEVQIKSSANIQIFF
jgi:hypothetical protein